MIRIRQTDDLDLVESLNRVIFYADKLMKPEEVHSSVWWVATADGEPVGFAGLQPFPEESKGYLVRAGVLASARGHNLQAKMIQLRAAHARRLGLTRVYTYVSIWNLASANNLVKCGFRPYYTCKTDERFFMYYQKHLTNKTK